MYLNLSTDQVDQLQTIIQESLELNKGAVEFASNSGPDVDIIKGRILMCEDLLHHLKTTNHLQPDDIWNDVLIQVLQNLDIPILIHIKIANVDVIENVDIHEVGKAMRDLKSLDVKQRYVIEIMFGIQNLVQKQQLVDLESKVYRHPLISEKIREITKNIDKQPFNEHQ